MTLILTVLEIASIMSLVTLAAMLTFRLAGFPDLSVDGVFALGGAVFAKVLVLGYGLLGAVGLAMVAGTIAGFSTATIARKLRINPLLASVLLLIILYSVNLRILGRPNR